MGAGAVGCFVGGSLQAAGATVHLIGRPRVLGALRAQGLRLTDLRGGDRRLSAAALQLHAAPPPTAGAGAVPAPALVLLCVKSGATRDAAAQLAAVLPPGTPLLSLQNGVGNANAAQAAAPALRVLAGMVPYNIAELAPGHCHRGTGGRLAAPDDAALRPWAPLFDAAGLGLALHADITPVLWGKLLLNLNNPVNALSGLPLRAQLLDRDCRRVLAALQAEALAVLRAAGVRPAQVGAVKPALMPWVLRLPDWAFARVAKRMLAIDDKARSSMADDLALGRPTEIDAFCGEIVRLGQRLGRATPVNERALELLSRPRPPRLDGAGMRALRRGV